MAARSALDGALAQGGVSLCAVERELMCDPRYSRTLFPDLCRCVGRAYTKSRADGKCAREFRDMKRVEDAVAALYADGIYLSRRKVGAVADVVMRGAPGLR
jgi:hypothetical protein